MTAPKAPPKGTGSPVSEPVGFDRGLTNYGDRDFARYLRRSMARSMGISNELLGKPIRGHRHFGRRLQQLSPVHAAARRGRCARRDRGRRPAREFPTISLGEVFLNPTSMMFRNLMSMDVEEMIRAQPMDAVVLIGGLRQDRTGATDGRGVGQPARPCSS